jgi:hypothetical protein
MEVIFVCDLPCSGMLGGVDWPLKMGPIGCPETSVNNYQSTAREANILRSYFHRGGSLKSFLFIRVTEQTMIRGVMGRGTVVRRHGQRSPRAAKWIFKWRNRSVVLKKFKFFMQNTSEFNKQLCFFLKFLISVRGGHYDYSPQAPKSLATPLRVTCFKAECGTAWPPYWDQMKFTYFNPSSRSS